MRMMLAGGGDATDSRPLDEPFANWLPSGGRLLYWPIALRGSGRSWSACYTWIRDVFRPFGLEKIEMWTDLTAHDANELLRFDAVYLGGGNTFLLRHELQRTSFDHTLLGFAGAGGLLYGGSAGAIVLGSDIMTCAHMDANEVGLADTYGLNLVMGHAIWCHYEPEQDALIRAYVQRTGWPVLALSERAGVARVNGRLRPTGYDPVYRFDLAGKLPL